MHDDQWLRVVLELMILTCLGISIHALKRDWRLLRPPYWRRVIIALLLVVFGHALATLVLLSGGFEITPGTWIGLAFYAACAAVLLSAGRLANRR